MKQKLGSIAKIILLAVLVGLVLMRFPALASDEAKPPSEQGANSETSEQNGNGDDESKTGSPEHDAPPQILTDLDAVPFPVKKMRQLLLDTARSGDIEKLRTYIGHGSDTTMLSLGGVEDDPIAFLKSVSGDDQGHEILAIMAEILQMPFVRLKEAEDEEVYVWPFFYGYPFEKLSPAQRVQLFSIITYGDYEEMETFGSYIFYRLGIAPDGRWRFFVAGD